ncbi:putative DNA topoisomerase 6 subunit A-like [Capsicum annuum]|nr:putative DNA topoisomerase 6 subunit A-like [Capsicum annuum]
MAVANWAELSKDLSDVIVKRVKLIEDFIAFSVVCTSWRNSATKANFDFLSPQLPLLMLADKDYVLAVSYYANYSFLACWRPGDLNWTFVERGHCGGISSMDDVFVEAQSDAQSKSLMTKLQVINTVMSSCSMTNRERYARKIYVYSGANFLVTVHGTAMNFCVMGSGNMFQSHGAYSSYNERGATTVVGLLQR